MRGIDVDYLNGQIILLEQCQAREREYATTLENLKGKALDQEQLPWWKSGEVVVGGVAVGFAFGGLIGYLLAK